MELTTGKFLVNPRARVPHPQPGGPKADHVELYGLASWLRSTPVITANLSPVDALALAEELTRSARFLLEHP